MADNIMHLVKISNDTPESSYIEGGNIKIAFRNNQAGIEEIVETHTFTFNDIHDQTDYCTFGIYREDDDYLEEWGVIIPDNNTTFIFRDSELFALQSGTYILNTFIKNHYWDNERYVASLTFNDQVFTTDVNNLIECKYIKDMYGEYQLDIQGAVIYNWNNPPSYVVTAEDCEYQYALVHTAIPPISSFFDEYVTFGYDEIGQYTIPIETSELVEYTGYYSYEPDGAPIFLVITTPNTTVTVESYSFTFANTGVYFVFVGDFHVYKVTNATITSTVTDIKQIDYKYIPDYVGTPIVVKFYNNGGTWGGTWYSEISYDDILKWHKKNRLIMGYIESGNTKQYCYLNDYDNNEDTFLFRGFLSNTTLYQITVDYDDDVTYSEQPLMDPYKYQQGSDKVVYKELSSSTNLVDIPDYVVPSNTGFEKLYIIKNTNASNTITITLPTTGDYICTALSSIDITAGDYAEIHLLKANNKYFVKGFVQ